MCRPLLCERCRRPHTESRAQSGTLQGACYYVLLAPWWTLALTLGLFLPIPLEGLGLVLDFGIRAGFSRFKQRADTVVEAVPGWVSSYREWARRVAPESILFLALCICVGVLASLAVPIVLFLIVVYGLFTMVWWLSLALFLPVFYSVMVIGR